MITAEKQTKLSDIKGYLFDIDGVLLLGKEAIPGAKELLEVLRSSGKHVLFVSNTSSRSRAQCIDQFNRAGIQIADEELFLASEETSQYIARLKPNARAYVLGAKGLHTELLKEGIEILSAENVDPRDVDFVVIGRDRTLTYDKLTTAFRAIMCGAKFVAVNNDPTVPGLSGLEPGAGAVVAALSAMLGRGPDINMGKPATLLLEMAAEHRRLRPDECVMIGDTIEVDVVAGNRAGMTTILVLSGNSTREDLDTQVAEGDGKPDIVVSSVKDLLEMIV
jgi:4-nitrophenyl phosphatase